MITASNSRVLRTIPLMLVLVCFRYFVTPSHAQPINMIGDDFIYNPANKHYYKLMERMNWIQAEEQAVRWGGHLVTINNREEELWLISQFGANECFWIGFNDISSEGNWVWISGEPVTYTNWSQWEPNNEGTYGEVEHGAIMNWSDGGAWNDNSIYNHYRGIVETSRPVIIFLDKDDPTHEVTGVAADGSTEVIICVIGLPENLNKNDVQISLPDGEEDGSLKDDKEVGYKVVTQTYIAPKAFVRNEHQEDIKANKREINLKITFNLSEIKHEPLYLIKPPVIMLHGLWSNATSFADLNRELSDNGFMFLCRPSYNNSASFSANDPILPIIIETILDKVHEADCACSKVDIVAHSMGGLLAKRLAPDFARKKIRKIITVGSPYRGSPLADRLLEALALDPFRTFFLEECLNDLFHTQNSITGGAIKDLRCYDNPNIPISTNISGVDCRNVIVGLRDGTLWDLMLNTYITGLGIMTRQWTPEATHDFIFGPGANSDWVVPEDSQIYDASIYEPILVHWHCSETQDADFLDIVIDALNQPSQIQGNVSSGIKLQELPVMPVKQSYLSQENKKQISSEPNSGTVKIVMPVEGQNFVAGEKIKIHVQGSGATNHAAVFAFFGSSSWADIVQLPWEDDINIPSDSVGSAAEISIIGLDADMNMTSEDSVNLVMESDIVLEDILFGFGNKLVFNFKKLPRQYREFQLYPIGKFGDGSEHPLGILTEETAYTNSNENVAVVDPNGLITARSVGTTEISITNSGVSANIDFIVKVDGIARIKIVTEWDYENPDDPNDTEYTFLFEAITDKSVENMVILTPAGGSFEITKIPEQEIDIPGGYIKTGREYDVDISAYQWYYKSIFDNPNGLDAYGDGNYTITVQYNDGRLEQKNVWYGIPDINEPIPQPTKEPIFTSFANGDTLASPVTFTWEPCIDPNVNIINVNLENEDTDEDMNYIFDSNSTGFEEPLPLSDGQWEADLSYVIYYQTETIDGVQVFCCKYSQSNYTFFVP